MQTVHIPGHLNIGADAISQDNVQVFHMQVPKAHAYVATLTVAVLVLAYVILRYLLVRDKSCSVQ